MSENKQVDKSQTIINYKDTPTLPPPRLEVGAVAWVRQNLFGSPVDIAISILSTLLIVALIISFFDWAVRSANWFVIINNQRLFMMETFERVYEWRLALTVLLAALLTGISFSVWARQAMRAMTLFAIGIVVVIVALPPLIQLLIPPPASYFAAGNVEIVDRASTLLPQPELAFIAQAGETVDISIASDETQDINVLSDLSGFADRTANALSNAAQNRIDQRAENAETFDQMLGRELTDSLQERTRLGIRTAVRTNDMVASTITFTTYARDQFVAETWTIGELEIWIARLEDAVDTLEEGDEAITAITDELDTMLDGADNASVVDGALLETVDSLTTALIDSPNIEAIGEALVNNITTDLIAPADTPLSDEEQVIFPDTPLATFLRDMYIILLTPQSVIETYAINQADMQVEILDGQSLDVLAEGVITADGDAVSVEIPADGWYVLRKAPIEGEDGTAIVAVHGIFPIVERTLGANESLYVRLTDNELEVTDARPQISGADVPFAVLIDNQYRGLRSLPTYLVHFVPLFLNQLERVFLPFILVLAWGFVIGRSIAHIKGENSNFNTTPRRIRLLIAALLPLVVVLGYFGVLDDGLEVPSLISTLLKIAVIIGAIFIAGQIDAWMNRSNRGADAEASITSWLLYAWGIFPVLMFVLASGLGDFSGATLGSVVGGLLWLGVMYTIGLNFSGLLGYGLLIGGFLLQIVQTHVIDIVWDTWTDSDPTFVVVWLALIVITVGAGYIGHILRNSINFTIKRLGYMLGSLGFVYIFFEHSGTFDDTSTIIAAVAIILMLMWTFFNGAHMWTPTRAMIGIVFMTYITMEVWTPIDKWSIIYFLLWLAVGVYAFSRGEETQQERGSTGTVSFIPLLGLVIAWLVALIAIPQLVLGMDTAGILQTSPDDLLPLSDKRAWGGLMLTMQLTILGVGASFPIGLALALGRRSNLPVVKTACILYIEAVRGVPLITVLFLATLLVPLIDPTLATIEGAVRVWVGVTMFSAAYLAENVRGGLQSIPKGQTEAAQAIGLSQWQTTLNILLPQALRAVIPALVGQFISLFKDTSLVVIVGLAEITGIANRVVAQPEFLQKRQEAYLYIAIIYFVFSYIMSYISRRVEETGSGAARARQI
jgi:His/Glu/Gln/Arg/opine family amino acid ABC transporter permease subunit